MRLYLVNYARLDIVIPLRELYNTQYYSTDVSSKEILQFIKPVLNTREMGLRIEPLNYTLGFGMV
jgi:hypothetical protein